MSVDNENRPFPLVLGPTGEKILKGVQLNPQQMMLAREVTALAEYATWCWGGEDMEESCRRTVPFNKNLVSPLYKWFERLSPENLLPGQSAVYQEVKERLSSSQGDFDTEGSLMAFGRWSLEVLLEGLHVPEGESLVNALFTNPDQRSISDIVLPFYHDQIEQFPEIQPNENQISAQDQAGQGVPSGHDLVEMVTQRGEPMLTILNIINRPDHLGSKAGIRIAILQSKSPDLHPEGDKAVEAYKLALAEYFVRKRERWIAEGKMTKDTPIELGNAGTLNFYSQPRLEEVIKGELAAELPFSTIFGGIYLTTVVMFDRVASLRQDSSVGSGSTKLDLVSELLRLEVFSDEQIRKFSFWEYSPDRQGGTGGEIITCIDLRHRILVTANNLKEEITSFLQP